MLTFYICLSVFISFVCSLLEAVILSITPSFLSSLRVSKPVLYKRLNYLKKDIEKPLASILTFNTIAHTIGAAGAGAEAQKLWGNEYLALFSAVLTFVILFFSEIIPKSIGAKNWKSLLPLCYYLLKPMISVSFPIVWVSGKISKLIKGNDENGISREEIPALAELGLKSGAIKANELKILKSLLKFQDIKLENILRPAELVGGVKEELKIEEAYRVISEENTFSRLIVFGVNRNDVKGYVMRKQILQSLIDKKDSTISDITRSILVLTNKTSPYILFEKLLAMKVHIAAVIDDSGNFLGILTLEDLIENIIGHLIYDESDS